MDRLVIQGGTRLDGRIAISGAKNAALPLMCASVMGVHGLTLKSWPDLADTQSMRQLLESLGIASSLEEDVLTLLPEGRISTLASYDLVRKMRASILVLGPLLARMGEARVSLPGGCAIGSRPVDLHIMAMERLGAEVELSDGYVVARAPSGLRGNRITFPTVSVGATENAMMAAAMAKGETVLINAAREPEINDLAACLNAMGARISGHGTDTITIDGVTQFERASHRVVPDRIEAGTFAIAAAMTAGRVTLERVEPSHLDAVLAALAATGARIEVGEDSLTIEATDRPQPVDMVTEPYPGFPTDLQAQFMALMCIARGAARIGETIFENRFMHVPELARMGADISVSGGTALIRGVERLTGARVMATDLRASVSLVLAGLVSVGETEVQRVYHLDRGYYRLQDKLNGCGASIRRIGD